MVARLSDGRFDALIFFAMIVEDLLVTEDILKLGGGGGGRRVGIKCSG